MAIRQSLRQIKEQEHQNNFRRQIDVQDSFRENQRVARQRAQYDHVPSSGYGGGRPFSVQQHEQQQQGINGGDAEIKVFVRECDPGAAARHFTMLDSEAGTTSWVPSKSQQHDESSGAIPRRAGANYARSASKGAASDTSNSSSAQTRGRPLEPSSRLNVNTSTTTRTRSSSAQQQDARRSSSNTGGGTSTDGVGALKGVGTAAKLLPSSQMNRGNSGSNRGSSSSNRSSSSSGGGTPAGGSGGVISKSTAGRVPDYILKRKAQMEAEKAALEQEMLRIDEAKHYPPGMRPMTEEERLAILQQLKSRRIELDKEYHKLPVRFDTQAVKQRRDAIEREMEENDTSQRKFDTKKILYVPIEYYVNDE